MEYWEIATKMLLQENQYQIAWKLSAKKFDKRFEIHCDQIESWRTLNLFLFLASLVETIPETYRNDVESYSVGVMCLF